MEIYVLNGFETIGIINVFESCIWNVQYFSQNDFQLVLPADQEAMDMLTLGRYLVRAEDVTATGYNNVMAIQDVIVDFDSDRGWILTLKGKGLKNEILKKRIVWSQTNLNGLAEVGIRQVITDNIISPSDNARKINDVVLDTINNYDETIDMQLLGENLAAWLEEICTTYGYGWDVKIDNSKYVFMLYKGTDRTYEGGNTPVVFSPEYDNLLTSSYEHNLELYKNAALIGGEGEGTAQRTAAIGTATGMNRYEDFIDGSSVSSNGEIITLETYIKMLKDYGQTQINQTVMTEKISGSIDPDGMYKLNRDYFLGDIVQIDNGNGIAAVTRITEIIYAEDESGTSVVPTFSEWEVE